MEVLSFVSVKRLKDFMSARETSSRTEWTNTVDVVHSSYHDM